MQERIELLPEILESIGVKAESFYSIELTEKFRFQGNYKSELAMKIGGMIVGTGGYVEKDFQWNDHQVTIILTE